MRRSRTALAAWLCGGLLTVLWPRGARSALSVMPHHTDGIVMQLRSAIMIDEKDLVGPVPQKTCSSLDDGPFCDAFRDFGQSGVASGYMTARSQAGRGSPAFFAAGDEQENAQYVVDGVLSHRMQMRNKEAFDWSVDTYRTFSSHVSRVVGDSLTGKAAVAASDRPHQSVSAKSRARCYRVAFNRLPVGVPSFYMPPDFSAGLPADMAVSWEGLWEPILRHRGYGRGLEDVPWRSQLLLRTSLGYLRFKQAVILRRFVVGVHASDIAAGRWGEGGLICGRLESSKLQKWCIHLDQAAQTALEEHTEKHGPPGPQDFLYFDVGHSFHAVDEVAIIAAPADSMLLALVEVVATPSSDPLHTQDKRKVVLLKRPAGHKASSGQVEPVLTSVSNDAVLWDLNEVLKHHMQLRNVSVVGDDSAKASVAGKSQKPGKPIQQALRGFQEMLQELKNGGLEAPRGVSMARLKKEVVALVASTKEIQDEDILRHSKIESLLQQRLQEKRLDALLALQAAWRRSGKAERREAEEAERTSKLEASGETSSSSDTGSESESRGASPHPRPRPKPGSHRTQQDDAGSENAYFETASERSVAVDSESEEGGTPADARSFLKTLVSGLTTQLKARQQRKKSADATVSDTSSKESGESDAGVSESSSPAVEETIVDPEEAYNSAAASIEKAGEVLEKKSEELKEQQKQMAQIFSGGENMAFEMNLEKGTVEMKVVEGEAMLRQIAKQLGQSGQESSKEAASASDGSSNTESKEGIDTSSTAEHNPMMERMQRLIATQQALQAGEIGDTPEADAEGVQQATQALHQNIQEALRSHFDKIKEAATGQDEDDGTEKKPPIKKVQVHVLNLDAANGGNQGNVAEMLQALLAQNAQQGGEGGGALGGMQTIDLSALNGGEAGNVAEALQAMLGSSTAAEQADAEDPLSPAEQTIVDRLDDLQEQRQQVESEAEATAAALATDDEHERWSI